MAVSRDLQQGVRGRIPDSLGQGLGFRDDGWGWLREVWWN